MGARKLQPKKLRLSSQIERARLLAEASIPMVAELYRIHGEICEAKRSSPQRRSLTLKGDRRN
jgi:hypothetical protein